MGQLMPPVSQGLCGRNWGWAFRVRSKDAGEGKAENGAPSAPPEARWGGTHRNGNPPPGTVLVSGYN